MNTLTLSQYEKEVQNYPGSVILFFTAPWAVNQSFKTQNFLQSTNLNVKIFMVDYDSEPELDRKFGIRELPFVISILNGQVRICMRTCETEMDLRDLLELNIGF